MLEMSFAALKVGVLLGNEEESWGAIPVFNFCDYTIDLVLGTRFRKIYGGFNNESFHRYF